jgi:hypothetical protein
MQNLFFTIREPWTAIGLVEFYGVDFSLETIRGRRVTIVQEIHGWWNNDAGTTSYDESFAAPAEAFDSFADAINRYSKICEARASTGFPHSFAWNRYTGKPMSYKPVPLTAKRNPDLPEDNSVSA